jgi:hypothetical protein
MMVKYPQEFPPQLAVEMKQSLKSYRSAFSNYSNMFFGSILYWFLLRSKPWFKLTGNPVQRLTFTFLTASYMLDMNFAETEYLTQQIYANNKYF